MPVLAALHKPPKPPCFKSCQQGGRWPVWPFFLEVVPARPVYNMLEPQNGSSCQERKSASAGQHAKTPDASPCSTDAESSFQPLGGDMACPAPARQRTACTADRMACAAAIPALLRCSTGARHISCRQEARSAKGVLASLFTGSSAHAVCHQVEQLTPFLACM